MKKKNVTERNLLKTWEHLDQACGNLEHAVEIIQDIEDLPSHIKEKAKQIDFSPVTELKDDIEHELIRQTGNEELIEILNEDGECDD
ncbi:hypothetical protein JMA_37030 (plasmid) [Jeotgalibacillus malaysiensis]|uniref:Uncharacterized protein n=1 Tax=Jeotgalibacillus malaysiensis TaxID=1508404 RepID=A0A0B5ASD0_9BACL|nr:hypothetical protein [Jeotgalibacillus malaysiensis]AJD93021.1 hypothetical protein JMA_37030 [Jeotgalibacillus malaysiensis]